MTTVINGSGSADFETVLPAAEGGTGATASTGSGNVVLSASPTLTGTLTTAAITASGNILQSKAGNTELMSLNTTGTVKGGIQCLSNQSVRLGSTTNYPTEIVVNNAAKLTVGTNGVVTLAEPLPVASGGTGTSTGIVASASGDVKMFAGASIASGWLACNGALVSRSTYSALFTAIGTAWGAGDGSSTFALPDLRGRAPVGVGTGASLTARALAATGGAETHTLSTAESAAHTHTQDAHNHTQDAHNHTSYTGVGAWPNVDSDVSAARSNHGVRTWTPGLTVAQTATNQAATSTNQNTGGGGAHNNVQPFAAINFIIKT